MRWVHSRSRVISLLLALGLIVALGVAAVPPTLAEQGPLPLSFAGGSGTAEDPYLVATAAQLDDVRNHLDAHFLQIADIDLGVAPWNEGEGWAPIGTSSPSAPFKDGSYDGGGHAIRNMTINRPTAQQQALFGYTQQTTIRNVRMENVNVLGGPRSAGLAGSASFQTVIENCSAAGQVMSSASTGLVGGLVGAFTGTAMHNVSAVVDVQGTQQTGGLTGYNSGEIRHAYTMGSVVGTNMVGGLVGWNIGGTIADSYSRATVNGADEVGGLVGRSGSGVGTTYMYRSYSTGPVSGSGDDIGGLLGRVSAATVDAHCYWDTEASGQATSALGTGRTTAQMQQQSNYEMYNFYSLWTIVEGQGYPEFRDLAAYTQPQPVDLADLDGDGTEGDPYIIRNAHQLNAMRQELDAHYRLGNDIDLSSSVTWDYGRGWSPVGISSPNAPFIDGSFDGAGYAIRNLAISRPTAQQQALFGYTYRATIRNVRMENVNVLGGGASAALAGSASFQTVIENCSAAGEVMSSASAGRIGGLVGAFTGTAMHNVSAVVDVQGTQQTGGLTGYNSGEIRHAYTMGSVVGTNMVGGLVGWNIGGTIADSYSRAYVNGADEVGGLVGRSSAGVGTAYLYRSYSAGGVAGTGANVGGFLGSVTSSTVDEHCYWDTQTSGQATSARGAGRTTAQMTHPYDASTYDGWDWTSTWAADAAYTRNSGYPYLQGVTPDQVHVYVAADPVGSGNLFGSGTYSYGSQVTASVVPFEGWHLVNWTENGVPISSYHNVTFSATRDRDLLANLALNQYTIALSASPAHGGQVLGAGVYTHGVHVVVTATADVGFDFLNWTEDGLVVSTDAEYAFMATGDRALAANFAPEPDTTVGLIPPEGGNLTSDDDQVQYIVPAGAFTETVRIVHVTQPGPSSTPHGKVDVGRAFTATALLSSGLRVQPDVPLTVIIGYGDTAYQEAIPGSMALWWAGPGTWLRLNSDDDTLLKQVVAEIDHFSEYALFGDEFHRLYLPITLR